MHYEDHSADIGVFARDAFRVVLSPDAHRSRAAKLQEAVAFIDDNLRGRRPAQSTFERQLRVEVARLLAEAAGAHEEQADEVAA